jgi:hypothetical protein
MVLKLVKAAAITAVAAILFQSLPDIARYLRMRNM